MSRLIEQQAPINSEYMVASIKHETQMFQTIVLNLQHSPVKFNQNLSAYENDSLMQRLNKAISSHWLDSHVIQSFTNFIIDVILFQFLITLFYSEIESLFQHHYEVK